MAVSARSQDIPAQAATTSSNHITSSRKRSRSGSRRPTIDSKPAAEDGRPSTDDLLLDQWVTRDQEFGGLFLKSQRRAEAVVEDMRADIKSFKDFSHATMYDPGRVYGEGFAGYGNGWTAQYPTKVIYPAYRKRPGMRRTPELRIKRNDRAVQADQFEELAPIRLDCEFEKLRLRDTFTWNTYDRTISPSTFAQSLVEDLQIPLEAAPAFIQQVNQQLQEQIVDHHPHPYIEEEPLDPHLPYSAYKNDEIRITIKLNITIGQHALLDQFEWDINNKQNSPEEFAARLARDMALSGEFKTAIAHQIREQVQMFTKSLFVTGHPFDGRPVEDPDVKDSILPSPLPTVFRPYQAAKDYAPFFLELNAAELEKADSALSREQRSIKRSVNRRGGPAMPDLKDRFTQTVRTMVISSVIPGAAESIQSSGVYKPARATTGRGRARTGWKVVGEDDSEESEGEESDPESPVRQAITQGTARTRGIRGAAAAASAAMRAGYAGSMTPDTEARTSRRFIRTIDDREDSIDDGRFVVRIKLPRERFRQWWRDYKAGIHRQLPADIHTLVARNTPQYHGMPPPPFTPGAGNRNGGPQGYMGMGGQLGRPISTAQSPQAGGRSGFQGGSGLAGSPPVNTMVSLPPIPRSM